MKTFNIRATEHRTAREAILEAEGDESLEAVRLGRRYLVIDADVADYLQECGISFAYLGLASGRVVTVPVN